MYTYILICLNKQEHVICIAQIVGFGFLVFTINEVNKKEFHCSYIFTSIHLKNLQEI